MSVDRSLSAPAKLNDAELRYWYGRYMKYAEELRADNSPNLYVFAFEEFRTWWLELPSETRQECMNDYQTGYNQLIAEDMERTRAAIAVELLTPPFESSH